MAAVGAWTARPAPGGTVETGTGPDDAPGASDAPIRGPAERNFLDSTAANPPTATVDKKFLRFI
ncbi:MAG: hypothetical protein A2W03_00570 [Candidatus Aminicenantes bacterium RBG_16_63_16]|nr:MAG: hypothetical protein A2W03_00570 [Candidatus Aminicenantes bacterium RBG_16_63_16]